MTLSSTLTLLKNNLSHLFLKNCIETPEFWKILNQRNLQISQLSASRLETNLQVAHAMRDLQERCQTASYAMVCLFVCFVFFPKRSIIKQLLDSVSVIFRIIKVSVSVISPTQSKALSRRPRLITLTYHEKMPKMISTRFRALCL